MADTSSRALEQPRPSLTIPARAACDRRPRLRRLDRGRRHARGHPSGARSMVVLAMGRVRGRDGRARGRSPDPAGPVERRRRLRLDDVRVRRGHRRCSRRTHRCGPSVVARDRGTAPALVPSRRPHRAGSPAGGAASARHPVAACSPPRSTRSRERCCPVCGRGGPRAVGVSSGTAPATSTRSSAPMLVGRGPTSARWPTSSLRCGSASRRPRAGRPSRACGPSSADEVRRCRPPEPVVGEMPDATRAASALGSCGRPRGRSHTPDPKDLPCSAPTRPARCEPSTSVPPSPSRAGWTGGAITVGSRSWTCGTPRASPRSSIRDEAVAHGLRAEYVLQVTGEVGRRPAGNENPNLATGEVELVAAEVVVLNESEPLPFQVSSSLDETVGEEARLKYRYLDLRRPAPARAMRLRAKANQAARRGARRAGLRRGRDPDADALDARGRPRLPGARAPVARVLVRAPAVAAAVQAAAHGRRARAVLPDRPLLPRRGLPRRPSAGVHAARRRDELRRAGRRHRARRADPRRAVGPHRGRRSRRRSRASRSRSPWRATATTSPTCGSGSSWSS